jgi:hypothetical protein
MNSKLYSVNVPLPKDMLDHLTICFQRVPNSDSSVEGHKRNLFLRKNKNLNYQQLLRIKNWFDYYDGNEESAPFILNGEAKMRDWVNQTVDQMRNNVDSQENVQNNYMPDDIRKDLGDELFDGLGWLKDLGQPSRQHKSEADNYRVDEDLKRIKDLIKKVI